MPNSPHTAAEHRNALRKLPLASSAMRQGCSRTRPQWADIEQRVDVFRVFVKLCFVPGQLGLDSFLHGNLFLCLCTYPHAISPPPSSRSVTTGSRHKRHEKRPPEIEITIGYDKTEFSFQGCLPMRLVTIIPVAVETISDEIQKQPSPIAVKYMSSTWLNVCPPCTKTIIIPPMQLTNTIITQVSRHP